MVRAASVGALGAELDEVEHGGLGARGREAGEAGAGLGAVALGARHGLGDGAVAGEEGLGTLEVVGLGLLRLERAAPEGALGLAAAGVGDEDRQGDLAVPEVVADRLAERRLPRAVVE